MSNEIPEFLQEAYQEAKRRGIVAGPKAFDRQYYGSYDSLRDMGREAIRAGDFIERVTIDEAVDILSGEFRLVTTGDGMVHKFISNLRAEAEALYNEDRRLDDGAYDADDEWTF